MKAFKAFIKPLDVPQISENKYLIFFSSSKIRTLRDKMSSVKFVLDFMTDFNLDVQIRCPRYRSTDVYIDSDQPLHTETPITFLSFIVTFLSLVN